MDKRILYVLMAFVLISGVSAYNFTSGSSVITNLADGYNDSAYIDIPTNRLIEFAEFNITGMDHMIQEDPGFTPFSLPASSCFDMGIYLSGSTLKVLMNCEDFDSTYKFNNYDLDGTYIDQDTFIGGLCGAGDSIQGNAKIGANYYIVSGGGANDEVCVYNAAYTKVGTHTITGISDNKPGGISSDGSGGFYIADYDFPAPYEINRYNSAFIYQSEVSIANRPLFGMFRTGIYHYFVSYVDSAVYKYDLSGNKIWGESGASNIAAFDWNGTKEFFSVGGDTVRRFSVDGKPINSWLEVGDPDASREWEKAAELTSSELTGNIFQEMNDALNYGSCDCDGCNLVGDDCRIPLTLFTEGYSYFNLSMLNVSFKRVIDINFYDEITGDLIDSQLVSLTMITDSEALNYSTTDGSVSINYTYNDSEFLFRYSSASYPERTYVFSSGEESLINLSVYLLGDGTGQNVTASVYDEYLNEVEGAVIIVQKYDLSTNTYQTVERISTNFEGTAQFIADLNNEYYRFMIYYDDVLAFNSQPAILRSTSLTFQILTSEPLAQDFYNLFNIDYSLTFNNDTNNFKFIYSDNDGLINTAKLITERITSSGNTLINETALSSTSGTILHGVNNVSGYVYKSCAFILYEGSYELLDCQMANFTQGMQESGSKLALFFLILIMIVLALVSFYDVVIALIIFPLPWIVFEYIGMTTMGISLAVSLEILCIIIALIIGRNR